MNAWKVLDDQDLRKRYELVRCMESIQNLFDDYECTRMLVELKRGIRNYTHSEFTRNNRRVIKQYEEGKQLVVQKMWHSYELVTQVEAEEYFLNHYHMGAYTFGYKVFKRDCQWYFYHIIDLSYQR